MSSIFKKIGKFNPFRKQDCDYTLLQLDRKQLAQHSKVIEQIRSGALTGLVIDDFLTTEEIQKLLKGYQELPEEEVLVVDRGFKTYPMGFAQFEQSLKTAQITEQAYHERAKQFRERFPIEWGIPLENKIQTTLSTLFDQQTVNVPEDEAQRGSYHPFTFRELLPEGGRIKAHCENYFFHEFPHFFKRFAHFSDNKNQLSYFVCLQQPEKGGALTLYDARWDRVKIRLKGEQHLESIDGEVYDLEDPRSIKRETIHLAPGSLIIFAGGNIWHRVEMVEGAKSRITIGGFISFSPDARKAFFWS